MLKKKHNEGKEQEHGLEKENLYGNQEAAEDNPGKAPGNEQHASENDPHASGSEEQDTAGEGAADDISMEAGSAVEEKLSQEIQALNDKYLRLFAEFDNYKRRSVKERVELIGTASKSVILALLPVLDDFDRAQKSMESATDVAAIREGIELIVGKFRNILAQQGLKEMESIGMPFNADLHEAVSNIPAPSEDMKGKVVDQLEKGYYLNDKVIRFAKVFVGA